VSTDLGATAYLTGCTVSGGNGDYYFDHTTFLSECTPGGPGVQANGSVWVRDSVVAGGAGGANGGVPCAAPGVDHIGPGFTVVPGESLSFTTGPLAREGADLVFAFRGAPHAEVWLMGSPFARVEARPTQHGFLLLGLPRALDYMGRTDASGALDVLVPLGLLPPTWDVRRVFLQPLMIEGARGGPGGKLRARPSRVTLGAGSAFLVLDNAF
jgi:hypothetical protein